jgi:hypothetical protein
MTPIVGRLYKTHAGDVVRIIKENKGLGFPFVASDGEHYDHEGKAYHGSRMDLKELVTV